MDPDLEGRITSDLDDLIGDWIGHEGAVTVMDVSDFPREIIPIIVGTMLRVVYDLLLSARGLEISGSAQPLLVLIDEAHRFVRDGDDTAAHRAVETIAKEGRKHGVGLIIGDAAAFRDRWWNPQPVRIVDRAAPYQ